MYWRLDLIALWLFFLLADKSSSFIGPLVVGLISDVSGNIRYSFFFLAAMIWSSLPLLSLVDVEQGQDDAKQFIVERTSGLGEYIAVPYSDDN